MRGDDLNLVNAQNSCVGLTVRLCDANVTSCATEPARRAVAASVAAVAAVPSRACLADAEACRRRCRRIF
jgi:hypothetical protein